MKDKIRITIEMPVQLYEAIKKEGEAKERTVSAQIRYILGMRNHYLTKKEEER